MGRIPWRKVSEFLESIETERSVDGLVGRTMQSMERLVGFDFAINAFTGFDDLRRIKVLLTLRAPDSLMREYVEHFAAQDTWLLRHKAARMQLVSWTDEPGTEFKSWVRGYGLRHTVGISDLAVSRSEGFVLALHRQGTVSFSEGDVAILNAIFPHLHNLTQGINDPVSFRLDQLRHSGSMAGLTAREQDIAFYLAARLPSAEIADRLYISRRTVEKHIEHIYSKLKASGRAQARKALLGDAPVEPPGRRWRQWLLPAT